MADQPLDAPLDLRWNAHCWPNDRTLIAWILTTKSLIAFGSLLFKFFQYLADADIATRSSVWVCRDGNRSSSG